MEESKIYVAVGKEVKERESTLNWALKQFPREPICVIYVHVPAQAIPTSNGFVTPSHALEETYVRTYQERERDEVTKILDDCTRRCASYESPCESVCVEKESVTDGILELISRLRIAKLVMGGAANSKYTWKMAMPTSKKANYVLHCAPDYCNIWFTCKDRLIFSRDSFKPLTPDMRDIPPNRVHNSVPSPSDETICCASPLTLGSSSPLISSINDGSSPSTVIATINDDLQDQLQQALEKAELLEQAFLAENEQRRKAKEKALEEAIERAKQAEREQSLVEELEATKIQLDKVSNELLEASVHMLSFERRIEEWNLREWVLEQKVFSTKISRNEYKKRCDKLQRDLEIALRQTRQAMTQAAPGPLISRDFSMIDLEEATMYFDTSMKIGEGGYGIVYRGNLRHTEVAIKIPRPGSSQGLMEFKQEADALTRLRHPNLVTLYGTCTESWALIYEYLPNGNLEDRLNCKDNTFPPPWQVRIRIATELCSVLNFLHSSQPNSIIHADLETKNILLDANFVSKLSGFGFCHVLPNSREPVTTEPKGTITFLDPEFLETGLLTPKSDIYSFGVVLLCLLTGRPTSNLVMDVQDALSRDDLYTILDHSAGDWPFVRAKQLAYIALKCCNIKAEKRPDLASEVWRVLKPVQAPSRSLSTPTWLVNDDQVPPYFICPIFQEIMRDPHFAADGFTYEADALKGWFEGGHNTSPMTNLVLAHQNLTPNRALRSTIQEWQQLHRRQ